MPVGIRLPSIDAAHHRASKPSPVPSHRRPRNPARAPCFCFLQLPPKKMRLTLNFWVSEGQERSIRIAADSHHRCTHWRHQ
eukprot:1975991-Rhodomonas_salina.4